MAERAAPRRRSSSAASATCCSRGRLEQFDYVGATALALVMLVVSFAMLLAINGLGA